MKKFAIIARRNRKNAKAQVMTFIEAATQTEALRAYGCNVKKGQRKVVTKRGTVIIAKVAP
jgi:hypothetical protein